MQFSDLEIFRILNFVADLLFKSSVVVLFCLCLSIFLKRASASLRSRVWSLTLIVLLLMPALGVMNLGVNLTFLPDISGFVGGYENLVGDPFHQANEKIRQEANSLLEAGYGEKVNFAVNHFANPDNGAATNWWQMAMLILVAGWIGMAMAFLFCQILGLLVVFGSREVVTPEAMRIVTGVREEIGITRKVSLKVSDKLKIAMTSGLLFPRIIVPSDHFTLSENNQRAVLLHEMAHVARWDRFFELAGQVARALLFFNPLVWFSLRKMRIERERSSDDLVLRNGVKPSDYASQLMMVAASLGQAKKASLLAATLSQAGSLKERLLCILNPTINRKDENRIFLTTVVLVLLLTILPLSAFNFSDANHRVVLKQQNYLAENYSRTDVLYDGFKSNNLEVRREATSYLMSIEPHQVRDLLIFCLGQTDEKAKRSIYDLLAIRDKDLLVITMFEISENHENFRTRARARAEAINYKDDSPSILNGFSYLGFRLLEDGYIEESIEVYKKCVQHFPLKSYFYERLGDAYLYNDDLDLAKSNFLKALELNPENRFVQERLELLEE